MQVVLIRHAHSIANAKGVLSGRIAGVHLSPTGITQSQELIARLGAIKVAALRISPLERCRESISPWWDGVGKKHNRGVEIAEDHNLLEVDYGKWSGKKLSVLATNKSSGRNVTGANGPAWTPTRPQPSNSTVRFHLQFGVHGLFPGPNSVRHHTEPARHE